MTGALAALPALAVKPRCADEDGTLCKTLWDLTKQGWLASSADWLVAKPLKIVLILVVALVLRLLAHRAIGRLVRTTTEGTVPMALRPLRERAPALLEGSLLSERRRQRAETIGSVLRSIASFAILAVAFVLILGELGINLAPIVASAGILGVAVGFGAQNLVKDFLTGIFMILEDQYGVGDVIDAGEASGAVEAVGLRTTRLRDVNGVVWYIRNGEIVRVGNMSQGWSRVVLDVPLAYETDLAVARRALQEEAERLRDDPEFATRVLEDPEVWGVEQLGPDDVVMRLVVKTAPLEQWTVARALRERIKDRLQAEGIGAPRLGRIYVRGEGAGGQPAEGD